MYLSRRAHRFGQSVSVLMIDVDLFKAINDRFGHPVADQGLYEAKDRGRNRVHCVQLQVAGSA